MKALEKLNKFLELPEDIIYDVPKITITYKHILIENYKYIIEFRKERLLINTNIGILSIEGGKFEIKKITKEEILVNGLILKLEFFK